MRCTSRWIGGVLIASAGVLVTGAVAQQADLVNRGFENGPAPGEMTEVAPGSNAIQGWTVAGGNVWYVGSRWRHALGERSVALPCGSSISQTFETQVDQEYEVRFSIAGDPAAKPALKTLVVSFGPDSRNFTFDTTGRSTADMGWEARFWIFEAIEATTTLTFTSPKTDCSTPAVDNVRLTAVEIGVGNEGTKDGGGGALVNSEVD